MASFAKLRFQIPKTYWLFFGIWLAGLVLGTISAAAAGNQYLLLMRMAPGAHVSIVGLLATVLLPFLLTAYAVLKNRRWMLYAVCFVKVFAFGFCGYGITAAYGSAGWLIRSLLQFSDIFTVPILCWYSLRNLNGGRLEGKWEFWICVGLDLLICSLDFCYISPFLALITKT